MSSVIRGKEEVAIIESELNQLIYEYEMFFKGYEKVEPVKKREKLKREIMTLQTLRINNPIIKQKAANLTHKFATFQRKWDGIWLQIENGTYKIDKYKIKIRKKLSKKQENDVENKEINDINENNENNVPEVKNYDKLLNKYEVTQKLLGVDKVLNKELLSKKLQEQAEVLKRKYKAKDIDFKVIIKDGKATIKPILVKE
jgi:hypothetical protein